MKTINFSSAAEEVLCRTSVRGSLVQDVSYAFFSAFMKQTSKT